jgi:hypothetical protein
MRWYILILSAANLWRTVVAPENSVQSTCPLSLTAPLRKTGHHRVDNGKGRIVSRRSKAAVTVRRVSRRAAGEVRFTSSRPCASSERRGAGHGTRRAHVRHRLHRKAFVVLLSAELILYSQRHHLMMGIVCRGRVPS